MRYDAPIHDLLMLIMSQVPQPVANKPTDHELYVQDGPERKVNCDFLKTHFIREGRLKEAQAIFILEQATNIFSREANMVPVRSPVTSLYPFFYRTNGILTSSSLWGHSWPICESPTRIRRRALIAAGSTT